MRARTKKAPGKLRVTWDTFVAMSNNERGVTILVIGIVLFMGSSTISLAPFSVEVKMVLFGLFVIGVARVIIVIGHRHAVRQHPDDNAQLVPSPDYETHSDMPSLPPLPSRPPISAATPPGGTYIETQVSDQKPPRRKGRRRHVHRELVEHQGVKWLVIHTYRPIPQGRFKKPLWRHKIQRLELDNSADVVARYATKIKFTPTEGERKIYWLDRLHWWSHGPAQLGILVLGLAVTTGALYASLSVSGPFEATVTATIVALPFTAWFFYVRIEWSYRYLMLTNIKIRLHFVPPFKLPRRTPQTNLNELKGGINPESSTLANLLGYGTVMTETVAAKIDNWLLKDVKFVKHYERFASLMDQLREDMENTFRQPEDS